MALWLTRALRRIRDLASQDRVRLTMKALEELEALDLVEEDAYAAVARLERRDFSARLVSKRTGEWMYVFKPQVDGTVIYVKLVLRGECVMISFHEEDDDEA